MPKNQKGPKKDATPKAGTKGKQLPLIDVTPENLRPIMEAAQEYKEQQVIRMAAGVKEAQQKQIILELVTKAKLQPLADGKIRFECDGLTISVTPRDMLVQVTEKKSADVS